ncbi:MAG: DNA replication/repair protein RecF [Ruminococcaceae bacterium]|nr:DNA replication/repair protein RecF [Oscillospiraceae bacterium]
MVIKKISAADFRNIESCSVEFTRGVNVLAGDNAQGKTNLLEAIYFTALGKSFRPVKEAELVRFGCEGARLENVFEDSVREQRISVRLSSGRARRVVEHNGIRLSRMSELVGQFRVVLFCPEHLSLVQGGPEMRRNYLNVAISQLRPMYLRSLQRYNQILKERNSLIRRAEEDRRTFDATIDFWSEQLAEEAAIITCARAEYVRRADRLVAQIFADMSSCFPNASEGGEVPRLEYASRAAQEDGSILSDVGAVRDKYLELLTTRKEREILAGSTLYGVHRDDIKISLCDRPARIFASQGQQRSLALAMKLAEGDISAADFGGDMPVFLFDDVLSELDSHRRAYLMEKMDSRQVIMSTCELSRDVSAGVNLIKVEGGKYFS